MSIDIYIPSIRTGIEYQGIQHFKSVPFFGGDKVFTERVRLDSKKYDLCINNDIKLLYFTYEKNQIPSDYPHVVFYNESELLESLNGITVSNPH